jgi:hypothetical protein
MTSFVADVLSFVRDEIARAFRRTAGLGTNHAFLVDTSAVKNAAVAELRRRGAEPSLS